MCYQIYTYLDNERDTIVLNNINQQTVALHTAEMQMERERFSLFAKSGSGSHGRKHGKYYLLSSCLLFLKEYENMLS